MLIRFYCTHIVSHKLRLIIKVKDQGRSANDLDETSLHVTSVCGLNRGVHQTFTTGNGVEKHLGWRQTGMKTVPNEASRSRIFSCKIKKSNCRECPKFLLFFKQIYFFVRYAIETKAWIVAKAK